MSTITTLLDRGELWNGQSVARKPLSQSPVVPCAPFYIPELDQRFSSSGLRFGVIHEWTLENALSRCKPSYWVPPVLICATLIRNALEYHHQHELLPSLNDKLIVFIGRRCWPSAEVLNQVFYSLQEELNWHWRSHILFIDPPTASACFQTILETLKNPNVAAVCAEMPYTSMTASRRLQLAAKEGQSIGFLARAPHRSAENSAAYSRWKLTTVPSEAQTPSWQLERVRCRENPEPILCHLTWCFDETRKTYSLRLSSPVVNRHSTPQTANPEADFVIRQKAS